MGPSTADAIDERVWREIGAPLVAGSPSGALRGQSVAVKDLFAIAGHRVGAGVRAYLAEAAIEPRTAPAVQVLLDAGADVVGIAQTDQFAYSIAGLNPDYGTPPNGAVSGAVPGGSSSGPASAVALGQASIGIGTDTWGSIRVPASYQGLWGLRTTHGAVSVEGVLPLAPRFDTVGWLTRDGETLLAAAQVTLRDHPSAPLSPRVVADPQCGRGISEAVKDAFHTTVAWMRRAALADEFSEVALPSLDSLFAAFRTAQSAEAWRSDGAWVTAHPGILAPDIAERFAFAAAVSERDERDAVALLADAAAAIDALLADSVMVLPSAASPAPPVGQTDAELDAVRRATLRLTAIAGVTGRPALSVPWMTTPGGPVGLSIIGPRGSDLALVELALSWHAARLEMPDPSPLGNDADARTDRSSHGHPWSD